MSRHTSRTVLRALTVLAAAATVLAAQATGASSARAASLLDLDPAASHVSWTLGSTFHEVHGTFALTRGEIRFDALKGEASGLIEISATSGESGNKSRDKKMHEDVLESARFPAIVFHPESMSGTFDPGTGGEVSLQGTIELHGIREKITVEGQVTVTDGRLTGTASMTIPYVAWGMKDPSAFIFRADKEVEITLHLDGILKPESAVIASTSSE